MKKFIIFMMGIIAVGVIFISIAGHDIPEVDGLDLVVQRLDVADEDNAYTYFCEATNCMIRPGDISAVREYSYGMSTVACEQVVNVIVSNSQMFAVMRRGVACDVCVVPEVDGAELIPYLHDWLTIGKIMGADVSYQLELGNSAAATARCVDELRFGNLVQQGSGPLIQYLVGVAVLDMGLGQAMVIARDGETSLDDLNRLAEVVAELGPFNCGLVNGAKVEYRMAVYYIDKLCKELRMEDVDGMIGYKIPKFLFGRRIPGYVFKPNETKAAFADLCRKNIANIPRIYADVDLSGVEDFGNERNRFFYIVKPNAVGKLMYNLIVANFRSVIEKKCRLESKVAGVRLVVALRIYKKKNGCLPDSLSVLVPDYIDEIPRDPYDGKPFRYDKAGGIVYAVGGDLKDSGGSTNLIRSGKSRRCRFGNTEDIVFEMGKNEDGSL
jgi:hypothetical protein